MSIESTSVPNPVVREIENSSRRNARSETQGSATGSKDGQFSSFWDKAFSSAQRLFGIDSVSTHDASKGEDSAVENENREKAVQNRFEERRLNATPGFGSTGFHRFSASRRPEDPPGLVMLSSSDRSQPGLSDLDESRHENRLRENAGDQDRRDLWVEEHEDEVEEDARQAKTADPPVLAPPPFAKSKSNNGRSFSLDADNQGLASSKSALGINPAEQDSMTNRLATKPINETANIADSPLEASEAVSVGGIRRTLKSEAQGSGNDSSGLIRNAASQEGEALKQNLIPTKAADAKLLGSQKGVEGGQSPVGKDADSLAIDSEKAKRNLSNMLEGSKSPSLSKGSATLSGGSVQSQFSGITAAQEGGSLEKETGAESTSKSSDSHRNAGSKGQPNTAGRIEGAKPQSHVLDQAISESSAPRRGERPAHGSNSRSVDARPLSLISARPMQGSPVNSTGISTGKGTLSGGPLAQERLGDSAPKGLPNQESESGLKASASTQKLSGPAPKSEGAQGFQMNGSEASGSRKTSFSSKTQGVSYSTKSTEETNEVYKALSKSVDRLTTGKSDVVSIRLSFDQGGTMALRVSMESGQINATMQTDLPGLESLIKASWSEFANELNQKGLKIGSPQFSQIEGENSKSENLLNLEQKGGQSKGESSSHSRAGNGRRASSSARQEADLSTSESMEGHSGDNSNTDQELETYA